MRAPGAAGRSGEQAAKREIYFQVWSRNVNLQTGNISFEARDLLPGIGWGHGPGKRGILNDQPILYCASGLRDIHTPPGMVMFTTLALRSYVNTL